MEFRIADTFTNSLAKLTGEEQKAVKQTAFDLQINPANPGMQFHRIDRAKDPNFWSVRVSSDIRLIVHKTNDSLLLCYVDHHDDAYAWAERRKLETHPTTGAAQLVEVRETFREVVIPIYIQAPATKALLFSHMSKDAIMAYGVPAEWVDDVLRADEDTLLSLTDHLPGEAAEALLDLATGTTPQVTTKVISGTTPFNHPEAQRRFRVIHNEEELERALTFPWEKWTIFLHPTQRQLVERDYNGPARVSGSAGTGKTVVALHRAVFLARKHEDARILLATFSNTMAQALKDKLFRLVSNEPRLAERIDVHAMTSIGERLFKLNFGAAKIASTEQITQIVKEAASQVPESKFSLKFLITEWDEVVDAWQIDHWEAYKEVPRLGRKTRLPEPQRAVLWKVFELVRAALDERGLLTYANVFNRLAIELSKSTQRPFDFAIIDESQDMSVPQLRFLQAMTSGQPNGLFFTGDLGQRIFQTPFSWKSVGVDVRGRSFTLRINYRTSHQIRKQADLLLGTSISDVDGNVEDRRGTKSAFNGPDPTVIALDSPEEEQLYVSEWIKERITEGLAPEEIAVFVRSAAELGRAQEAVEQAGLNFKSLDENASTTTGLISISTMHNAKGLEFKAVAVMACDNEIIPLQERIETVTDPTDLDEVYNTERHLLYVACTRARDYLLVTCGGEASEFLGDLKY